MESGRIIERGAGGKDVKSFEEDLKMRRNLERSWLRED